uniref:Uncharacterized protein n=1 Tax=Ciona savignyi TaxID=51511 RepID=H2YZG1_CIOSA
MRNRWVENKKMDRLAERTTPTHLPHHTTQEVGINESIDCVSITSSTEEVTLEDIEGDHTIQDNQEQIEIDTNNETGSNSDTKYHHQPPFATTAHTISANVNREANKKASSSSLSYDRDMETLSCLLHSLSAADKRQEQRVADQKPHANNKPKPAGPLLPTADATSLFYQPPLKLPPNPLWTTLQYSGDRVPHRLGVQYKTVATKRYHAIHPETVPDLRDFRPPQRRSKFLDYHTSVF